MIGHRGFLCVQYVSVHFFGVCRFPRMVVFKMTNSSFCFLASIFSTWCFLSVGRPNGPHKSTHTKTYSPSLFFAPSFIFNFTFTFIYLLNRPAPLSFGLQQTGSPRNPIFSPFCLRVRKSRRDYSMAKHTEQSGRSRHFGPKLGLDLLSGDLL